MAHSKVLSICFIIPFVLSSFGCEKENEQAILPAYISIDSVLLEVEPGQGSSSHLITETWVYTDSVLVGAYSIPSIFPILETGIVTLDIFPGIRENGQGSAIKIYPLLKPFQTKVETIELEEFNIMPVFAYYQNVIFQFVEGFESGNLLTADLDEDPNTKIQVEPMTGSMQRIGKGTVSSEYPVLEVATNFIFENLPVDGRPVFLELDYKSDVPLAIGLRGHQSGRGSAKQYKLLLIPRDQWQKIYINFSEDLKSSQLDGYQIILLAQFDSAISVSEQNIYLDNLKLLHF